MSVHSRLMKVSALDDLDKALMGMGPSGAMDYVSKSPAQIAKSLEKVPLSDVMKAFAIRNKLPLAAGGAGLAGLGAGLGLSAIGRDKMSNAETAMILRNQALQTVPPGPAAKLPLSEVLKAFAMKNKLPLAAGGAGLAGLGAGLGLGALGRSNSQY